MSSNKKGFRLAYSLAEVAKMLGVSIGHLRNEHRRGHLKLSKCGNRTVVLVSDLDSYLENLSSPSVEEAVSE